MGIRLWGLCFPFFAIVVGLREAPGMASGNVSTTQGNAAPSFSFSQLSNRSDGVGEKNKTSYNEVVVDQKERHSPYYRGGSGGWGWGGGGGGGGGGGWWKWGCGKQPKSRIYKKRVFRREDYKVGEYAQCRVRGRCRGMRLDCPLHCGGPCSYDCRKMCKAHCRR